MTNNDVLRSVRFVLNVSDAKLAEILALDDYKLPVSEITAYLKDEEEQGFESCADEVMGHFLNGLVYFKRGKDASRPPMPAETRIDNNVVLKKLRVAFNLKEDDILSLITAQGLRVGKSELSAFFRRRDHANYRKCGDQFLRNFLKGLAALERRL